MFTLSWMQKLGFQMRDRTIITYNNNNDHIGPPHLITPFRTGGMTDRCHSTHVKWIFALNLKLWLWKFAYKLDSCRFSSQRRAKTLLSNVLSSFGMEMAPLSSIALWNVNIQFLRDKCLNTSGGFSLSQFCFSVNNFWKFSSIWGSSSLFSENTVHIETLKKSYYSPTVCLMSAFPHCLHYPAILLSHLDCCFLPVFSHPLLILSPTTHPNSNLSNAYWIMSDSKWKVGYEPLDSALGLIHPLAWLICHASLLE